MSTEDVGGDGNGNGNAERGRGDLILDSCTVGGGGIVG